MLKRSFLFLFLFFAAVPAFACDSCLCTVLGRRDAVEKDDKGRVPVYFEYLLEQQNWNTMTAAEAHTLHHQGHHVHNKTHEEYHHLQAGFEPHERVTILADMPYVVRESIEIHGHRRLGQQQVSEGWGDLHLVGVWRAVQNETGFVGPTAGVKFPTGGTKELNPDGERYEPELQPGSGSYDLPVGGVFRASHGAVTFSGNAIYIFKTEGDQDYEFGDVLTASLVTDLCLNPSHADFRTSVGLDINFQHEEKHKEAGVASPDSGGDVLLAGPALTIKVNENSLLYGTFLFPVAQNMGGVHQELDHVWTAGARIKW